MVRSRRVILLLLVVVVFSAFAPAPVGAEAENGRISFTLVDYEASTAASWSVRPDGSDPRPILAEGRKVTAAAYSPDGALIAADLLSGGSHHLVILDRDGAILREVLDSDSDIDQISWAPNGTRLVFSRNFKIWVVRLDGSHLRRLASQVGAPRWSPHGDWILYVGDCPGACAESLYVIRPSGRRAHRLVDDAFFGDWAPAGNRVVFYRFVGPQGGDSQGELFTVRADGSRVRRLTFTERWNEGAPVWSPGGGWIAYSRWSSDDVFNGDLFKLNLATGNAVRVTRERRDVWVPLDWGARPAV
jgi:Tol biopolymer transport system component